MKKILSQRDRIKRKIRARVQGTALRPRLSIYRSNSGMSVQLIDDESGKTVLSANDTKQKGTKMEGAVFVGKEIARLAKANGIATVIFDRNGFKYAGRVKAVADAAREGGLEF